MRSIAPQRPPAGLGQPQPIEVIGVTIATAEGRGLLPRGAARVGSILVVVKSIGGEKPNLSNSLDTR
jgi:hypothetical protein